MLEEERKSIVSKIQKEIEEKDGLSSKYDELKRLEQDPTIIEYIQPKITDIFRFHCDISGNMEDIQTVIQQYKEQD